MALDITWYVEDDEFRVNLFDKTIFLYDELKSRQTVWRDKSELEEKKMDGKNKRDFFVLCKLMIPINFF